MGLSKSELLTLPISICNWIILSDYLEEFWDTDILRKMLDDYFDELPLYIVERLFYKLETRVDDVSFQQSLDYLFGHALPASLHKKGPNSHLPAYSHTHK